MTDEEILERILAEVRPYEFRTMVLGFSRPADYDRSAHEASFRRLKVALGDELNRRLGVEIEFRNPELRVDLDEEFRIRLTPAPIYVGGRYRKLSRGIPASRWIHHPCKGRGCPACSHTGNLCGPSIEELLARPILEFSRGKRALFHALGREDTDARMLGRGRPFVLEIHNPVRRTLPLTDIEETVAQAASGLAEVRGLTQVGRPAVDAVKAAAAQKTYRAWIELGAAPPPDTAERAVALGGAMVDQQSPRRVMHRRGREVHRPRRIVESTWLGRIEGLFVWEIRVESGMYVKELVSGDEGRTRPSLAEALEVSAQCVALDVLEVHWEPPWEVS